MSKIIAKPGAAYDVLRATSAAQIAAAARLSQPTVSRVFRGEPCQIKTAKNLCQAVGCGFSDLFELRKGGGADE